MSNNYLTFTGNLVNNLPENPKFGYYLTQKGQLNRWTGEDWKWNCYIGSYYFHDEHEGKIYFIESNQRYCINDLSYFDNFPQIEMIHQLNVVQQQEDEIIISLLTDQPIHILKCSHVQSNQIQFIDKNVRIDISLLFNNEVWTFIYRSDDSKLYVNHIIVRHKTN